MEINNRANFEYNNRRERERRYLSNGNGFQSKDGDYRNLESTATGKSTLAQNNKRSTSSIDSQRNSVVFEHIVPGSVKKMWVMAESGSFDKQEQPEQQKNEQRLSSKYGNFFLSRDAAKESKESNAEMVKQMRSNSVSESTELPQAKSQWGVNLKPVGSTNSHTSKRNSGTGNKPRPRSVVVEGTLSSEQPKMRHRSQSLEKLDQLDSKDGDEAEYPTKLSVQQRMKSFETSNNNVPSSPVDNKYAYLHTKRPLIANVDLRGKSDIFYQPKSTDRQSSGSSDIENKSKKSISLKDLLKQDEENLSVDVVKNGSQTQEINQSHPKIVTDRARSTKIESNVFVKKQPPINVLNPETKRTIDKTSNHNGKVSFVSSQTKEQEIVPNKTENKNTDKVQAINKLNTTPPNDKSTSEPDLKNGYVNKPETPKSINIEPKVNFAPSKKTDALAKEKIICNEIDNSQTDKKVSSDYNKLGKTLISQESTTNKLNGDASKHDKNASNDDPLYIISNDKNLFAQTKAQSQPSEPLPDIVKSVNENISKQEKPHTVYPKESAPKKPTKELPRLPAQVAEPPKSTDSKQGIRRRVGRLIIMTGEQRDQQLKELERIKREGGSTKPSVNDTSETGLSLTFMSNEVADDDPDEPPPVIPTIIFNEPLPKLKSSLSKKKKKSKKAGVSFKRDKMSVVYMYPAESSFLDDTDENLNETHSAVNRERLRNDEIVTSQVETIENVNIVTEGADFNSFSNEEGGGALLF
ncbi:protein IWS1 homolog [Clytia hemisphaerica]|uniref:Uncharacterized protein n=1 Tax=Clytia hemisphaerica TaxID=252671 RepID=A0A7M5UYN4_9CNID